MFTGALEKSREAVHRSNATTLKSLAIQAMLTDPGSYADEMDGASVWSVKGVYDFTSEKFSGKLTIASVADFKEISVSGSGLSKSGKEIGRVPTTETVEYTVYFNQVDLSELFKTT